MAVILEEGVPVFVGALGSPGFVAQRFHDAGAVVMSVVGSTKQAVQVARDGADVVIAQGTEGGGHTGHVGTMALLPQVLDAVDVPVVAAGGIGDGRGLAAALVMGCEAVWVGHAVPRHRGGRHRRLAEGRHHRRPPTSRRSSAGPTPASASACCPTTGPRRGRAEVEPLPMPLQPVLLGRCSAGSPPTATGGRACR